jgi:O-antigen/teichoic acid export membrane protein
MLLGQAVGQVYLGRFAESVREETRQELRLFCTASRVLLIGGFLIGFAVFSLSPWAFALVFGSDWALSGDLAQALSLSVVAQVVVSPLGQTLAAYERGAIQLGFEGTRLAILVIPLVATPMLGGSIVLCVWLYSTGLALTYCWWWLLALRTVRGKDLH